MRTSLAAALCLIIFGAAQALAQPPHMRETPSLSEDVDAGKLPRVFERVPRDPLVTTFDAPSGEWYLYNAGLPDLALAAPDGQGEHAQPIAMGSYAPLKHNTRLLLGKPSVARAAYVELRKVG